MSNPSQQDLDQALTNARQSLILMQSELEMGRVERDFQSRLQRISKLLDTITEDRQRHADAARLSKLYEVSRAIGSSLDLADVLNRVMDSIIALTDAERGFLMLLDENGALQVRTARNFDQETLESTEIAFSRTITRQVFETGEPVITTNAAEDPRYAGQVSVIFQQFRSVMATPLRARGAIIGVVYVDNRIRASLFRESDLELLEAFAGQAGVAIENARLFEITDQRLAQRVEELEILQAINRQLNETLDLKKVAALAVEWVMRTLQADSASLAMLSSPDSPTLEILAHSGTERDITGIGETIPRSQRLIANVLETHQAVSEKIDTESQSGTLFGVPIRRESQTIGVIIVFTKRAEAFNADAQALITRMAERAAIAIENGRLYHEVSIANQKKSEFVGIVAHELKVPMTSIRGYADLILQFGEADERTTGFLERIKGSVLRMQTLVEDLSDISRIESGNLRVEMTEVDLREVLETAKAGTMGQIEEREHHYQEELPPILPKIQADPARAVQVLVNLLSNAYKYTPNGGTISVRAQIREERIYVGVKDTGVGLSPDELAKLGTKFWRSDNDHVLKQSGTGLGFNITRQLIDLMSGTLEIESEKGVGSTFTISWKISP